MGTISGRKKGRPARLVPMLSLLVLLVAAAVAYGRVGADSAPLERIPVPPAAAKRAAPSIWDFAETSGGKVLAAITDPSFGRGSFLAVRLRRGGRLDRTFGEGGFTAPIAHATGVEATGIATVPGGGFVLVGYRNFPRRSLVADFGPRGRLVRDFAQGGVAELPRKGRRRHVPLEALHGVAVAEDGTILTVGAIRERHPGVSQNFSGVPAGALAAYRPDGSIDTSFGTDGHVYLRPTKATRGGNGYTGLRSIAVEPDGRILVAGFERNDVLVARFLPDGVPDRSFGDRGRVVVKVDDPGSGCFGNCPLASPIAFLPDGKILVLHSDSDERPSLVRLEPDGRVDRGFGHFGVARLRNGHAFLPYSMAVTDDRVVLAGWEVGIRKGVEFAYSVHRYRLDGKVDRGFARDGIERHVIRDASAAFAALTRPSGEVWIGGSQSGESPNELLLGRLPAPPR